eukprot:c7577_g1_i3.p1 GENE.c7577_g1_i3~~c7577_g1_i3.p1  ORF type:complete len:773 (+),score=196.18 c7577_g1_i3:43-2361(+)
MSAPPVRRSRVAHLLATYYDVDGSNGTDGGHSDPTNIDGPNFDPQAHFLKLLKEKNLQGLVKEDKALLTEVKGLDGNLQTLVYENYSKFLSATDTIRMMKQNVKSIEGELQQLSTYMEEIQQSSEQINTSLSDSRAKIEQLNAVRGLVKKLQFIFELPSKLNRAVSCESFTQAVKFYTMASQILDQNSDIPSFRAIKDEADDIMHRLRAQMRESTRKPDIKPSTLSELVSLLLQLDEDDLNLRQLLVTRWTADIKLNIESLRSLKSTTIELDISAVHDVAVKNILHFARDFTNLFLNEQKFGTQSVQKARAQLDACVCKLMDVYLNELGAKMEQIKDTESVMALLQQVELNTNSLLEVMPFSTNLAAKYPTFAHTVIRRKVSELVSSCETRLDGALDKVTRFATEMYVGRVSSSKSSRNPTKITDYAALVDEAVVDATDDVSVLSESVHQLIDVAKDKLLFSVTVSTVCEQLCALHRKFHSNILAFGGLQSVDILFGCFPKMPSPLEHHVLEVLLLSSFSSRVLQSDTWVPVFDLISEFPQELRGKSLDDFTPAVLAATWSATSQSLLQVYVDWCARIASGVLIDGLNWTSTTEPSAVSAVIPNVLNEFWNWQKDVDNAFQISRKLPNEDSVRCPEDDDRLCSVRGKGALIQKDIARMFSQDNPASLLNLELVPNNVLQLIVRHVTKTLIEFLRREPRLELTGLNQVQVDMRCYRWGLHLLLEAAPRFDALVDEVLMSASDRCSEPAPASASVVDRCFQAARPKIKFIEIAN